jgi:hypothetical protein
MRQNTHLWPSSVLHDAAASLCLIAAQLVALEAWLGIALSAFRTLCSC